MFDDACVSVFMCVWRGGWKYQLQEKHVLYSVGTSCIMTFIGEIILHVAP